MDRVTNRSLLFEHGRRTAEIFMGDDAKPNRKKAWRWALIFIAYFLVTAFLDR